MKLDSYVQDDLFGANSGELAPNTSPVKEKEVVLTPDSTREELYLYCQQHPRIKNPDGFVRGWFNAGKSMG